LSAGSSSTVVIAESSEPPPARLRSGSDAVTDSGVTVAVVVVD